MKHLIAALAVVTTISACAATPGSIEPADVGDPYRNISCQAAKEQAITETAKLDALIQKQKNAVAGDAIGVALLWVPVSSLAGKDVAGEIAISKGKILSLESRILRCP